MNEMSFKNMKMAVIGPLCTDEQYDDFLRYLTKIEIKYDYQAHKCLIPPSLNPRWQRYRRYLGGVK